MLASSFLTILAAGVSLVAANDASISTTTTMTSTLTQTITITKCNPDVKSCPGTTTTTTSVSSWSVPHNTTSPTHGPTGGHYNSSSILPTHSASTPVTVPTTPPTNRPPPPAQPAAAGSVYVQTGFLLAALGFSMAVMA
jgi:hypothetical protein